VCVPFDPLEQPSINTNPRIPPHNAVCFISENVMLTSTAAIQAWAFNLIPRAVPGHLIHAPIAPLKVPGLASDGSNRCVLCAFGYGC
jgi:hypothetical protein